MRRCLIALCLVLTGCLWPTEPRVDADVRVPDALVSAALSGPGAPDWDAESVEGTYRVRMGFGAASGDGWTTRASNAFDLRAD